jgi:hypothetical protein
VPLDSTFKEKKQKGERKIYREREEFKTARIWRVRKRECVLYLGGRK